MSCHARVYPNSTAERDAPAVLAPAVEGGGVPLTINFDAMALALELAALRTSNERASRREFALVSPNSLQDTAFRRAITVSCSGFTVAVYREKGVLHHQTAR